MIVNYRAVVGLYQLQCKRLLAVNKADRQWTFSTGTVGMHSHWWAVQNMLNWFVQQASLTVLSNIYYFPFGMCQYVWKLSSAFFAWSAILVSIAVTVQQLNKCFISVTLLLQLQFQLTYKRLGQLHLWQITTRQALSDILMVQLCFLIVSNGPMLHVSA